MKKIIIACLICVIFSSLSLNIGVVYACQPEHIEFNFNGRVFDYYLENNIKTSSIFSNNYEINKYNRFAGKEERIKLLKKMDSLGFDKTISLEYLFPNLMETINSIEKNIHIAPRDAKLKINSNTNKVFHIEKEVIGISVNKSKLINDIFTNFINNKDMRINVSIKQLIPTLTQQDFQKFSNLRADFSTNISTSTPDRKHNIKNALMSLNKIEILPNQVFSFNNTVGRRTAENGYRSAKIIVNNEFVDGLGGGVCQVSSTLYNTALLAGLEIIEANKHSKQVSYVNHGFDAMVNFGSSDLKFRNNTNEKITIITNYSQSTVRIRIFGESLNKTEYKLKNEIINIVQPQEIILIDEKEEHLDKVIYNDECFYLKKANKGMEIKSYREKYENGNFVSCELLRHDKFKVQDAIKIYGSKPRNEEKSTAENCA